MPDHFIQIRMHQRLPPLIVMIDVPMSARISSRFFISSSGTGSRNRRILAVRARKIALPHGDDVHQMGCFVDTSAFPTIFSSRARVRMNRSRLRSRVFALALTTFVSPAMDEAGSPAKNYT